MAEEKKSTNISRPQSQKMKTSITVSTVNKPTAVKKPTALKSKKLTGQIKRRSFIANLGIGAEKDYFIENLSMLMASGMNITSVLEAIKGGIKTKRMKVIIDNLKTQIEEGTPIWKALEATGLLSQHAVSLIKIGEESGRLPSNLKVIAIQSQKERVLKSKIFSAMMYPVVVLTLTVVIGLGIAWFILPRLANVFASMRLKLPLPTKILIAIGQFLGKYGYIAVPLIILALFILIYFLFLNPKSKVVGQNLLIRTPGIKRLIQEIEISHFGYILGNLLEAGIPLVDALDSLEAASTFYAYRKLYAHLKRDIEEGITFRKSFSTYRNVSMLIPYPIQMMIISAEQSGNLTETLKNVAESYEEKSDITTKNLAVILEPLLLLVVWVAVLVLALSVIMPIYGMIGGISK